LNKTVSDSMIMKTLDWAYDKAVYGLPGTDSASEMAESYMKENDSARDCVNSLIRWQNTKAGSSGFITGLGGLLTLPVSIPANISSVMYVQIRMIASIAYIGGHDIKDDRVKTLVFVCMAGNAAKDLLKDIGIVVGTKFTQQAIKNVSGKTIVAINQKVGFRLVTKFGEKGAVNLGKMVPLLGGIIGGTFDSVTTNTIGNIARDIFVPE
jgi:hypothetical protein